MNDNNSNDEILLIDKPKNMSSFGVVARVRRVLSTRVGKKVKVGHTGTLDPFATGLLVLLVGKGTKRAGEFLKLDKEYEAELRLGYVSSTGDIEGEIRRGGEVGDLNRAEVEKVAKGFIGKIWQKVPVYSAVKINGRRAYDLARKGVFVEMPEREVTIYDLKILDFSDGVVKFWCKVSSGTYIRTLGEDIGMKLGVGGYLIGLRRLKVGGFDVKDAVGAEEFCEKMEN